MAIQWFPGHMNLTRKVITERVKEIDVVIEVLDARLPGSSSNPLLQELTGHKPRLQVLNKQDLADAARTPLWLDWYNAQSDTRAIALDASEPAPTRRLIEACKLLAPNRGGMAKPMRVLICGIPNVGKSTLINSMSGKRQAKTGDEAGITKLEQRIVLADDFYLWDTPGMLWPRIIVEQSGYNLAASGAVGRNAYDEELVALELLGYLQKNYADLLEARYKLGLDNERIAALHDDELLDAIGRRRGAMMSGGRVNLQKAAELVLTDFRGAILGRITLETPDEYAQWLAVGQERDAERQARKDASKARKRPPARAQKRALNRRPHTLFGARARPTGAVAQPPQPQAAPTASMLSVLSLLGLFHAASSSRGGNPFVPAPGRSGRQPMDHQPHRAPGHGAADAGPRSLAQRAAEPGCRRRELRRRAAGLAPALEAGLQSSGLGHMGGSRDRGGCHGRRAKQLGAGLSGLARHVRLGAGRAYHAGHAGAVRAGHGRVLGGGPRGG